MGGRFTVGEKDPGLEAAGFVTTVSGAAGVIVGVVLVLLGALTTPKPEDSHLDTYDDAKKKSETVMIVGGIIVIPSSALFLTGVILNAVNDSGTVDTVSDSPWVPRINGGPAVGGGFVGAATWDF